MNLCSISRILGQLNIYLGVGFDFVHVNFKH